MKVKEKIYLVLDSELGAYKQNGRRNGGLGSFNVGLQSVPNNGWTTVGAVKQYLFDKPDQDFIKSDNAQLLLKMYSKLRKKEKYEFENELTSVISKNSSYHQVSYLAGFFFIRIGRLFEVVEKAIRDLKGDTENSYSNFLHMINIVVAREYPYFSLSTYQKTIEKLEGDEQAEHAVLPTLKEALKQKIVHELEGDENEEIENDMLDITRYFHANHLEYNISNQIKHINDLFYQGNFDEIAYATCIDRVRVLISSVVKLVAIEKSKLTNEILDNTKVDKFYLKYLFDNKHISKEENELLISFYSLCSNNGAHISKSTKEVARLVKNMGIELVVLMRNYTA